MIKIEVVAIPFLKLAFALEPTVSCLIFLGLWLYLLNQKKKRVISDYRVKVIRLGKYYYQINLRLILTPKQTKRLIVDLVTRALKDLFSYLRPQKPSLH